MPETRGLEETFPSEVTRHLFRLVGETIGGYKAIALSDDPPRLWIETRGGKMYILSISKVEVREAKEGCFD